VYITSDETSAELLARARSIIPDLDSALSSGALRALYTGPDEADPDKVLHTILSEIDQGPVSRLVIDSVGPIEQGTAREDRFSAVLTSLLRHLSSRGVTTLLTREIVGLTGQRATDRTEGEPYWAIPDNIVLLRPTDVDGSRQRTLVVLKMRSSDHDEESYRFDIVADGLRIEGPAKASDDLVGATPRATSRD
jgi:circadian clock protein KaiC